MVSTPIKRVDFAGSRKGVLGLTAAVIILMQGCASPKAPTITPDSAELSRLGDAAYQQGRFDQAQQIYTVLTQTSPHSFDAWFRLGNTALRQGLAEQAERAYLEALKQDPKDPRAW